VGTRNDQDQVTGLFSKAPIKANERYTKVNILQSVPNIKTFDGMKAALSDAFSPEQSYS
jgi:hypothetical protein